MYRDAAKKAVHIHPRPQTGLSHQLVEQYFMENGVNWQRWWHVQSELRILRAVAGHNTVPGLF